VSPCSNAGIALLIGALSGGTSGQIAQLDRYIEEGLSNSTSLNQERTDYLSAKAALGEARSRFLPALWLKARYTRADGGRSVTIPVGEMVQESFKNSPLAGMLAGSAPPAPITLYIMPQTEQETKLQLVQPLFAPALAANYRLNRHLLTAQDHAVQTAALILIRDIRLAYFSCLQAQEVRTVYNAACKRSGLHLETARKLVAAGAGSETTVLGAKAAHARNQTDYARSLATFDNACKALNLLLDHPLERPLSLDPPDSAAFRQLLDTTSQSVESTDSLALSNRPEIARLESAAAASRSHISVEKSSFAPTLAAALEGGIIGDRYEITDRSTFYTASVLLEWELFSGLSRLRKVDKATAALTKIEQQTVAAKQQIRFQVEKTLSDLTLARRTCHDSELQLLAAEKNHYSVFKQFEQGLVTATELTEAAELLTRAAAARTVARYDLFKQQAQLQYVTAADLKTVSPNAQPAGSTR
jgi:outer membrane protein